MFSNSMLLLNILRHIIFIILINCPFNPYVTAQTCNEDGIFFFGAETVSVSEQTDAFSLQISVKRTGTKLASGESIVVSTEDFGSASTDLDFTTYPNNRKELVFSQGATEKFYAITIKKDDIYEEVEQFRLNIHSPGPVGPPCSRVGYPNNMTVSIQDDASQNYFTSNENTHRASSDKRIELRSEE